LFSLRDYLTINIYSMYEKTQQEKMYEERRQEKIAFQFHPYNILLTLVLMGVTSLFFAFSASYMYSRYQTGVPPIKLPNLFYFNTLILLASSGTMLMAKQSYRQDNTTRYQWMLLITIGLTLIFLFSQIVAWKSLFNQQIFIAYSNTASYVYVISVLHFVHVLAGLPFLILFLHAAIKRMKEPVSVLVYFSDPEKRLKLDLLTKYWHYLDGLWLYLVLFFWLNYLFQ